MDKQARCIELRTVDGKPILRLHFYEGKVSSENRTGASATQKREETERQQGRTSDGDLMTDPQKRFLFRIMTDQGFEGDRAHEHLKELFQVESLKEVTKFEASRMIERLLEEGKGGEEDGPSF